MTKSITSMVYRLSKITYSDDGLKLIYWTKLAKVDSKVGEAEFNRACVLR
jgi:hypothetical protein